MIYLSFYFFILCKNMNYPLLKKYIEYIPYTQDPQILTDNIIQIAQSYIINENPEDIKQKIQEVYEFAKMAHGDGLRLSGEQYIVHPLLATQFLMSIKPDLDTINACILHDVIEDTEYTYEDICERFGKWCADLCEGMVKVSKLKYRWEERQIETLKKTFFAFSKDLRVIFIKLADRIHNIQTLHYHPNPDKQKRIADETLTIYVPIAKRLGLYEFQSLLENGSFKILHPEAFSQIISYLDNKYIINSTLINQWVSKLENILTDGHLQNIDVKWRIKSPYRIWQKLESHDMNFDRIFDILAFRVIAKDIWDCYQVLWLLHNKFTPLDKRFKDFIAVPKDNGYKSIHTTVLWLFDFPVEIQIRTPEMEEYADHWVAAHFTYSDLWSKSVRTDLKQAERVNKIQEIVENYQSDNEGFKESMNIELLDDNIYVYTPKWDVIELSNGSTILDFAFRIHSNVWLRFRSGNVNGNIVPIDYRLKTWDIITVQTRKEKFSATRNWLNILHTPSAKNQVNRYLRTFIKDELIQRWKDILNEKLIEFWLPILWSKDDKISNKYTDSEKTENMFVDIGEKRIGAHSLINETYKFELEKIKQNTESQIISDVTTNIKDKNNSLTTTISIENIYIDWQNDLEYELCHECNPTTKDVILAKSWSKWIKIHTTQCESLQKIDFDKLLPANRESQESYIYVLRIDMNMTNKAWNLAKVIRILSDFGINISEINFGKANGDITPWYIYMEATNPSKFWFVIRQLDKYSNILEITDRKFI